MRSVIALPALALVLGACGGSRSIDLACDPEAVMHAPLEPDGSIPGFDYPKDALAILSWSRGTPMVDSSVENEVVFVYLEGRRRVGAAFVVRGPDGWVVDELWACPEG